VSALYGQPPTGVGNSGGVKWVVSAADKVRYDEMFEKADSDKDGYVNGTEIKGIFLKSGLQQQVLARIWFVLFIAFIAYRF